VENGLYSCLARQGFLLAGAAAIRFLLGKQKKMKKLWQNLNSGSKVTFLRYLSTLFFDFKSTVKA